MRIAFCLHGLAGGKSDKGLSVNSKTAHKYYKKHIFDKNEVDIFIHTWSVGIKSILKQLYKPKQSIFEKQIMFDKSPTVKHSIYSRWYSFKKVVDLKKDYEVKQKFIYDCVMVARFDLLFFRDIEFNQFDMNYFYTPNWDGDARFGMSDLWFFSKSRFMDRFSTLYDGLDQYLKHCELSSHALTKYHLEKLDLYKYAKPIFDKPKDFTLVREGYPSLKRRLEAVLRKPLIKLLGERRYVSLRSKFRR